MKLPSYQFVAQMGAAFAVVVSLGFVAFELKQARDVATAELAISVIQMEIETRLAVLDVESYNSGIYKEEVSGEELTHMERTNRYRVTDTNILRWSAKHVLWSFGLLPDGEWEHTKETILTSWNYQPDIRLTPSQEVPNERFGRESWQLEIIRLWDKWKAENPTVYNDWLAELAAEESAEEE